MALTTITVAATTNSSSDDTHIVASIQGTQRQSLTAHGSVPVSDSVPLCVLQLYILVSDGNKTTIMRSKSYRLRLRMPPPQWAWGVDLGQLRQLTMAMPNVVSHAKGMFYDYNDRDSEAIWCYSCSYEGKACE